MADAEVGDAWYGDDPTVNRLQERAAELTGTEAALYVRDRHDGQPDRPAAARQRAGPPGGRRGGRARRHDRDDDERGARGHLVPDRAPTIRTGYMTAALARRLLAPDDYFDVEVVDLLAVENTVGGVRRDDPAGRGAPRGPRSRPRRGVPIHLDGARIWNAAAATGEHVTAWTSQVDTMMFCLSKGLGAPIGSLLCGPAELIREARRIWILYGGAWRQAGIMAAAGLVALETGRERLDEDHARARRLGGGARRSCCPAASTWIRSKRTWSSSTRKRWGCGRSRRSTGSRPLGVGAVPVPAGVRMVTHVDVDDEGIGVAIDAWRSIAADAAKEAS